MNLLEKGDKARGDHTKKQEFTDIHNPYLTVDLGDELERRFKKKKRYWPGGRPMNLSEVQDAFEAQLRAIHDHGEFLCYVKVYNISDVVGKYILNPTNVKQWRIWCRALGCQPDSSGNAVEISDAETEKGTGK
jgi:hypothetical protein